MSPETAAILALAPAFPFKAALVLRDGQCAKRQTGFAVLVEIEAGEMLMISAGL
jgi:hypothetical protein